MTAHRNPAKNAPPPWKRRLYLPAYMVSEAARYAHTNTRTVTYWHYQGGRLGPALPGKERRAPLSYLELIEVAFVATMRKLRVSLQRIRRARDYARQQFHSEYPFAEYVWQTDGKHLLADLQQIEEDTEIGRLIVADEAGQLAWQPALEKRFKQFDYEHSLAIIWHVEGQESPIIIDPRIAFGAPTVRGLPTWVVKGRWLAGETVQEIQEDFRIEPQYIRDALAFEGVAVGTLL